MDATTRGLYSTYIFARRLSGKPLTGETGGVETIVMTNQSTVEVQEDTEGLITNVEGKTKYKRRTRGDWMAGKVVVAN